MKKYILPAIIALILLPSIALAMPSLDQVYKVSQYNNPKALQMMQEVLAAYPNSPKAHYMEAELLHNANENEEAKQELLTAEHLDPNHEHASIEMINKLSAQVGLPPVTFANTAVENTYASAAATASASHNHTLLIIFLVLLVLVVIGLLMWWLNDGNRRYQKIYSGTNLTPVPPTNSVGVAPVRTVYVNSPRPQYGPGYPPAPSTVVVQGGSSNDGLLTGMMVGEMMSGGNRNQPSETIINNNNNNNNESGNDQPPQREERREEATPQSNSNPDYGIGNPQDNSGQNSWDSAPSTPDPEPDSAPDYGIGDSNNGGNDSGNSWC